MHYTIKRTAVYGGKKLAAGKTIAADELRPGVLQAALRVGNIVPAGEEAADPPAPSGDEGSATEDAPADADNAGDAAGETDKPADGSLKSLGIPERFVKALAANDPPLITIDEALEYLDQHGTFTGVEGIGSKTDENLRDILNAAIG